MIVAARYDVAGVLPGKGIAPEESKMRAKVFETHLEVADLERAMAFYGATLGLALARVEPERRIAFYWLGGAMTSMLGLWEQRGQPVATRHTAFEVDVAALRGEMARLRAAGVDLYDFWRQPTAEPFVFGWMPAAAIYFDDPDGNALELIARLPGDAFPDQPVLTLAAWQALAPAHAGVL